MSYISWQSHCSVEVLKGKTLTEARRVGDEEIIFVTTEGETYKMFHSQDCCETVFIEDISGDLSDLVGSPILQAEEVDSGDAAPLSDWDESFTWTFYKLATIKGGVTIRWYGSSNGYYSERVDFALVPKDPNHV